MNFSHASISHSTEPGGKYHSFKQFSNQMQII
jgi:hypothetical protein